MSAPRLLDLFCGAGGAAMGYHRAGFEVVGVDIAPQPNYPFEFWEDDALAFPLDDYHVIHASPPCQRWSDLAKRNRNGNEWPDLIAPTRVLLEATGLPYVIENVEGAPLRDPIMLCGVSFPELRVIRHRLFESNVPLVAPEHKAHPLVFTHDKRKAHYGRLDQDTSYVQVTGGGNCTVANKRAAMGIDWMMGAELNEAIPPAYTEWIGAQLLAALDSPETPPMSFFQDIDRLWKEKIALRDRAGRAEAQVEVLTEMHRQIVDEAAALRARIRRGHGMSAEQTVRDTISRHMIRVQSTQLRCDCGWHCPRPAGVHYGFDAMLHVTGAVLAALDSPETPQ